MNDINIPALYNLLDLFMRRYPGTVHDPFAFAGALVAYVMAFFERAGIDAERVQKLDHDICELFLAFEADGNEKHKS